MVTLHINRNKTLIPLTGRSEFAGRHPPRQVSYRNLERWERSLSLPPETHNKETKH